MQTCGSASGSSNTVSIAWRLLDEPYKTLVLPGSAFGSPGSLRLGAGGDSEPLERGLTSLGELLDAL